MNKEFTSPSVIEGNDEIVIIDPCQYDKGNMTAANIYEDICRKLNRPEHIGIEDPVCLQYDAADGYPAIHIVAWNTGGDGMHYGIPIDSGIAAVFSLDVAQQLFHENGPATGRVLDYRHDVLNDMPPKLQKGIFEVFPPL